MIVRMKSMAQEVAQAARRSQELRTGHAPSAATVVLSEGMLVITLHGALTDEEQALAADPAKAAKVQKFHRQLFTNTSDELRQEIKRITGVAIREKESSAGAKSGTVIHVFPDGTMVQVFQLAGYKGTDTYSSIPMAVRA